MTITMNTSSLALIQIKGECRHGLVDMNATGLLRPTDAQLALCSRCPVLRECREYAVSNDTRGEWDDVWGGLTGTQRADMHTARNAPHCVCGSDVIMITAGRETCLACGISWII